MVKNIHPSEAQEQEVVFQYAGMQKVKVPMNNKKDCDTI